MNPRPDEWKDPVFKGWPPPIGVYQPSPLPPEFRRENEDLNMPRTDDELLERLENLYLFRPFF